MGMAGRTTDMQFETECNTHTLLLLATFKTYNANENNQKWPKIPQKLQKLKRTYTNKVNICCRRLNKKNVISLDCNFKNWKQVNDLFKIL